MRGGTTYTNKGLGTEIRLSRPAQQLLTEGRVDEFISTLEKWMSLFGGSCAYVGKCGSGLEIYVFSPDFGKSVVRVEP